MQRKPLNAVAIVLYLVCAMATVCLIIPIFINQTYSHTEKFITGIIVFVLGFIASKILCFENKEKAPKIMKKTAIWLFCIYTFIVIDYTLISDSFGRNISNIFWADKATVFDYFSNKTNIIPFATVRLFLNAYRDANLQGYVVVENILGNLFVLMPFAVFVPYLFKRVNTFLKFSIIISLISLSIEFLQIVFLTGSADIDDFILNVSGAVIAYGISKFSTVKRFINKFIFGEAYEN